MVSASRNAIPRSHFQNQKLQVLRIRGASDGHDLETHNLGHEMEPERTCATWRFLFPTRRRLKKRSEGVGICCRGSCALTRPSPGFSGSPAPPRLRSPPRARERIDLGSRVSTSHSQGSLPLFAPDAEAMWPAKPSSRLPALLLLALALSPPGIQGRPRGRRAARVAELWPQLFLPVTGTLQAPRVSRSAGKLCPGPPGKLVLGRLN